MQLPVLDGVGTVPSHRALSPGRLSEGRPGQRQHQLAQRHLHRLRGAATTLISIHSVLCYGAERTTVTSSLRPSVSLCVCRTICCTGATLGQTRSSASTWRLVRTERWFWPTTTWTCSPCRCLRATSTGVTGPKHFHFFLSHSLIISFYFSISF